MIFQPLTQTVDKRQEGLGRKILQQHRISKQNFMSDTRFACSATLSDIC